MAKLRRKIVKRRPSPAASRDGVPRTLRAQTDALVRHEALIARHTALQTYVAILTTLVLATITFLQYRAGERQVRLEYAKTANQYEVSLSYRDRDGSVLTNPWIAIQSAVPYDLKIEKTGGISAITRVEVFQEFRLMAEGEAITPTKEGGCVVGTSYMFTQTEPGSLNMRLPAHMNDNFRHTSFTMPDGRVGKMSAEETTIVIQFRDIFGKERRDVISGYNGAWIIKHDDDRSIYSAFNITALLTPGEPPRHFSWEKPSAECAPWMVKDRT